jgi:hypothetical protein
MANSRGSDIFDSQPQWLKIYREPKELTRYRFEYLTNLIF